MPCYSHKSYNSLDVCSPLLSYLGNLILRSISFSTNALNILNFSKASTLYFNKLTQHILVYSSINNMKYLSPHVDLIIMGSHMSIWISSIGLFVENSFAMN